jgi:hypothetical protein
MPAKPSLPRELLPDSWKGSLQSQADIPVLPGGAWYTAAEVGDGWTCHFAPGDLLDANYLSADFLLDGKHLGVFLITLQEGESGPAFGFSFGLLNQCQARLRMPLEATRQNRWRYEREGALLKPSCSGERVDLAKVDRLTFSILRKSPAEIRWCMTPLVASAEEPSLLEDPLLPVGPLLDELGQSTLHEWPTKSRSTHEVISRLLTQLQAAPLQAWPECFSRWGGWQIGSGHSGHNLEGTGYFRTHHDGQRWWLLDPDGNMFWSSGLDCVRVDAEAVVSGLKAGLGWLPDKNGEFAAIFEDHRSQEMLNYLAANFIRAFGAPDWYQNWTKIAMAELRRLGFNTVANWSDWQIARQSGIPYVRPLANTYESLPLIYRDFPDVFHPDYPEVAAAYAEPLRETAADPAFIGYFLMNEPTWGFAQETPAAGMLFNSPQCYTRRALADSLVNKYGTDRTLSDAWGIQIRFTDIAEGTWQQPLTPTALADLEDFSSVMVDRFFGGLSQACRVVDPNHLNLGIRYYTIPPHWALAGMRHFDVFSMNCYRKQLPASEMAQISAMLKQPILIGEWHFGALDAGLPASGIGHVKNQEDRGKAYRLYLEDAAAKPWCVGTHYFILYDQSALGRFDGENYNIGFLDVCNQPYPELAKAARLSHERMYAVAAGETTPYADEPDYLPLLFL